MGSKPSNIFQMDRPESGGADRDEERETSGLLDRAKQEFTESEKSKRAETDAQQEPGEGPGAGAGGPESSRKPRRDKKSGDGGKGRA